MFAMVLAIGLLVDDAIVVVENVERIMSRGGPPPWEATRKSMDEITSALVGIGLVLSAVFGPMVFFPGSTGVIYRQFSVTVIASMLLSVRGGPDPHAGALRHPPQAGGQGARGRRDRVPPAAALLPLVRPDLLPGARPLPRLVAPHPRAGSSGSWCLSVHRGAAWCFLYLRMPTGYLPDEDQGTIMAHGPAARGLDPGADRGGHGQGSAALPGGPEGRRGVRHDRGRHGLRRPGPEPGHGLRQAPGLGSARQAGPGAKDVAAKAMRAFAGIRTP